MSAVEHSRSQQLRTARTRRIECVKDFVHENVLRLIPDTQDIVSLLECKSQKHRLRCCASSIRPKNIARSVRRRCPPERLPYAAMHCSAVRVVTTGSKQGKRAPFGKLPLVLSASGLNLRLVSSSTARSCAAAFQTTRMSQENLQRG